jgi:glycosyltransferase involved in cell wall biosynthesis
MRETDLPQASVLICTRNRPNDIGALLPEVFKQDYPDFEVVLIDQSDNDATEEIVKSRYADEPRLRYIRSPEVGLTRARNMALRNASNELCAFTDDDTRLPIDWLSTVVRILLENPGTGVLFGPVRAPAEHAGRGIHTPCYPFTKPHVLRRGEVMGMAANMAMRKSAWQQNGPFDEHLGPGGSFPGGEEFDWLYRAVGKGIEVRLDPAHAIEHRAFRTKEEWTKVMLAYGTGDAACFMKHLRCGDLSILPTLIGQPLQYFKRMVARMLRRVDHSEQFYLRGYLRGLRATWKLRVDKTTRLYIAR